MEEAEIAIDFKYPAELPICAHREDIMSRMAASQVVIVCGDTGSGKTTQLPKMAMELGRGSKGRMIACTQPRRLAAVTVAERVAGELGGEVGGIIGYQHRYAKKLSDATRVKFMTDGVLLAETRADPLLERYDTIIIDEAHERTLNVDFLLGILKRIITRRRDLKVVISSATLDTERFSRFFGGAPSIVVPGRLYPVETIYAPPPEDEERDLPRDVGAALATLPPNGDVLVFLPGERDIRDTADHLARSPFCAKDEIIPLMASLPAGELARAFHPSAGKRRIILATNVAETSLTIPGIRAVIDSGLARIPRYIHRTQVQRLQIEPISQASARQRAGRCGRVGPGICMRLYSEEDFARRDEFTPPEILRSSLAGVILTMLDLRLGAIEEFPFIDPPKPTMVREGLKELLELGAIHRETRPGAPALTKIGRRLAKIPVEPRLARMMIAASEFATLPSVVPIVASMSCDDPRRRPADEREKADMAHAQFRDKATGSDFLGTLKLWRWWEEQGKALSQSQMRKLASKTYLSYPKMREWRDLTRQLTELAKRIGLDTESDNGGPDALHRALMSGLLSRIGHLDPEELDYRGAHGVRFAIHPASALAKGQARKQKPEWIMAGELVDTSRLFARNAAVIDPRWIESIAAAVVKRSYHSPEWDAQNGFVRALERVTLYGLVIVEGRRRDMSRIDPETARKLFILHALVFGEFPHPPSQVRENAALIAEMRKRAERTRRPELFDIDRLAAKFEETVPKEIVSAGDMRKWLHGATQKEIAAFRLRKDEWLSACGASKEDFPESIRLGGAKLALSYRHTPDNPETDGITCTVRKSDAPMLRLWRADWLVKGMLGEKVAAMLSSLPTAQRRILAPLSDTIAVILPLLTPGDESLADALSRVLYERFALRVAADSFDDAKIPNHLKVRFRIKEDDGGKILAASRNLDEALAAVGLARTTAGAASVLLRTDGEKHVAWDFGSLEDAAKEAHSEGWAQNVFKALHDEGDGVTIRLYRDEKTAKAAHAAGVARLIYLELTRHAKPSFQTRRLTLDAALYFKSLNYPPDRVAEDLTLGAIRETAVNGLPDVKSHEAFESRLREKRSAIAAARENTAQLFADILADAAQCEAKAASLGLADDIADDIATQVAWLMFPGFLRTTPYKRLKMYPRFFKALAIRIARAKTNVTGDRAKMARFELYWEQYAELVADKARAAKVRDPAALAEYRWMLEEYRISLFAPEVGTSSPVSPVRLSTLWLTAL